MKVSQLMTSPVVVTQKNKTVEHARSLLDRKNINAIPILSMEGEIEGMVTVSDLAAESDNTKTLDEIMTDKTYVVSPDSSIIDVAKMMDKHQVHHLVVMEDGQVKGIISSMDFVGLIAHG